MDKQFKIFSVDTKAFYTEEERNLNNEKFKIKEKMQVYEFWAGFQLTRNSDVSYKEFSDKLYRLDELKNKKELELAEEVELGELKQLFKKPKRNKSNNKEYKTSQEKVKDKEIKANVFQKTIKKHLSDNEDYKKIRLELNESNKKLSNKLEKTLHRQLNHIALTEYNQITLFENALSRAMEIEPDEIVTDMMVVRAYHYSVLKQLIENGFTYTDGNGTIKKFKVFTASAGQIRTKKVLFIEESKWDKYEKTLMCGLTIDDINKSKEKGCNINKFLAYLALCNSATDEIVDFDINRSIVIDDFETMVYGEVDFIDNKTFEVTRKYMNIPIPHSDGCGWVLNSKKNFMIRLPWVKGLMTPTNYIEFCDEYKKDIPKDKRYKIIDIYDKEWDLKDDEITYVFSKSQFKMHKYYNSWQEYKDYFKKYNCKANMCNLEPDTKDFRKASFNYQMWQTLIDITDEEIAEFTDKVDEFITKGYSDRKTMLQILGADETNKNKTYLQKCIEIYPELIRDYHVKEELASSLNARKKEAKYGKFKIDATYTFLLPDIYAWMECVLLGNKTPNGLLNKNEVSCRLYKEENELLVNRSPHLYREHAVRNNCINDNTKKWFTTDGIYTSCHDLISKILQFDNDGDRALVVADKTLKEIAKRNMKGIVPLYYEMGKASPQIIDDKNIYKSLTKAFKFNNIGKFSNKLTVMWNGDNPNSKLKTIAQITALNNFTIDGAKTLLVPKVPDDIENDMKESNGKLPYFFQFAKDRDSSEVAEINNSTVNRICKKIENIKRGTYDFSSIGRFNKNMLMNNSNIEINENIVDTYKQLEKNKNLYIINAKNNGTIKDDIYKIVYNNIKNSFKDTCLKNNITLIDGIDIVIRYIYSKNKNSKKDFLFSIFGDIIYENLKNNIKNSLDNGYIMCEKCGKRVKLNGVKDTSKKYCDSCSKEIQKELTRERVKKFRKNKNVTIAE